MFYKCTCLNASMEQSPWVLCCLELLLSVVQLHGSVGYLSPGSTASPACFICRKKRAAGPPRCLSKSCHLPRSHYMSHECGGLLPPGGDFGCANYLWLLPESLIALHLSLVSHTRQREIKTRGEGLLGPSQPVWGC